MFFTLVEGLQRSYEMLGKREFRKGRGVSAGGKEAKAFLSTKTDVGIAYFCEGG